MSLSFYLRRQSNYGNHASVKILRLSKANTYNFLLLTAIFLSVGGFYFLLLIYAELVGSIASSRQLTIPLRMLIVTLLAAAWIFAPRNDVSLIKIPISLLYLFSLFYMLRIFLEVISGPVDLYISPVIAVLYISSFVLIPCMVLSTVRIDNFLMERIHNTILFSCVLFSMTSIFFYREWIGAAHRLSSYHYDNVLSPLSLSYTAALGIGLAINQLLTRDLGLGRAFVSVASILLCCIPLFLGASRGPVLAIVAGVVVVAFLKISIKSVWRIAIVGIGVFAMAFYSSDNLSLALVQRVLSIGSDIQSNSSSAMRLEIWALAADQIGTAPLFGSSLQLDSVAFHPHNIFLEVLIATGVVGFLPFIFFLLLAFISSIRVANFSRGNEWVVVFFIQSLIANSFSGGVYTADWLALSAGLCFGCIGSRSGNRTR